MTNDRDAALRALLRQMGEADTMRKKAAVQAEHREWFLTHNHVRELAYHFIREHGESMLTPPTEGYRVRVRGIGTSWDAGGTTNLLIDGVGVLDNLPMPAEYLLIAASPKEQPK